MRLPKWFFNVVLFPGVIFHEMSHFIACIILGVRITETKFWGLEEAHVKHEEPSLLKTADHALHRALSQAIHQAALQRSFGPIFLCTQLIKTERWVRSASVASNQNVSSNFHNKIHGPTEIIE